MRIQEVQASGGAATFDIDCNDSTSVYALNGIANAADISITITNSYVGKELTILNTGNRVNYGTDVNLTIWRGPNDPATTFFTFASATKLICTLDPANITNPPVWFITQGYN